MTGGNVNRADEFNIQYQGLVCLLLVSAALAAYRQLSEHEFINVDDNL